MQTAVFWHINISGQKNKKKRKKIKEQSGYIPIFSFFEKIVHFFSSSTWASLSRAAIKDMILNGVDIQTFIKQADFSSFHHEMKVPWNVAKIGFSTFHFERKKLKQKPIEDSPTKVLIEIVNE